MAKNENVDPSGEFPAEVKGLKIDLIMLIQTRIMKVLYGKWLLHVRNTFILENREEQRCICFSEGNIHTMCEPIERNYQEK